MQKVYKIGDSKIHGKGLIAIKDLAAGDLVGLSHINNEATPDVGAFHNHSNNANTVNVEVGNERYLIVETPIKKGEEITVNYRLQPDLEQPEDFLDKALDGGDINYPISGEVNYVDGDNMTLQPTRSKTYANDILGQLTYEQQMGTELPMAQEGGNPSLYSFPTSKDELAFKLDDIGHEIENYLNNPSQRAQDFSDSEDELTNIDNLRHAMASRYTAEEIGNKVKEIPYVGGFLDFIGADKLAGLIGSNALGLGHEFSSLAVDQRPFLPALQETGEDAFNNLIGSIVGSTNMSSEKKDKLLTYLSHNNLLPDGYVKTEEGFSDDVYFKNADGSRKQNGGDLPKAQTGFGSLLKPKTNSVQIGSGIGGNTIFRDIKGLDRANFFHNQWYTHPDYINQIRNRNQWNLRDFNQNLIYSGENAHYPLIHKSGLVKDGDGFTIATDQIDPIAAKFSMENYQTGTIPDGYYWINHAGSPTQQFTPVKQGENIYEKFPFSMGMNFVNSNRLNAENVKMHGLWDEYRTKTKETPASLKRLWNNEFIPSWKKPWMITKRATSPAREYLTNSLTIGGHAQAFAPTNRFTTGVGKSTGSQKDWKRFAPSLNVQSGFSDIPNVGIIGMNYSFLDRLLPEHHVSTVVHERGHLLDNQGGIYPDKYRGMFEDAINWNFNTKGGKIGEKFGAGEDGQMNLFNMKPYYTEPTEQYARMMEERFRLGLRPGDEYTFDMFNQNPKMFGMGKYLLKDNDGVPVNFIKNMNSIYKEGGSLLKAQDGITEFEINKHGHIETEEGYDKEKLFEFAKDKYTKVNTATQKNDLVTKLNSSAFRERYKKNYYNITGETLSEEELTNRINQQSDFTGAGPDFHVTMPYITTSTDGRKQSFTPYISPFAGTDDDGNTIGLQGRLDWRRNQGLYQQKNSNDTDGNLFGSDYYDKVTNPDFPELANYPYIPQLNLYRDPYLMSANQMRSHDNEGNTIVHEYAHSYNTDDSPLFNAAGTDFSNLSRDEYDKDGNVIKKGTYTEMPGERYKAWLSNLFGEDYFDKTKNKQGTWAMQPWEISSIKAETEGQLKQNNIWDHTKGEFGEDNLDKMILGNHRLDIGSHGRDPLNRMGYTALERMHYKNTRNLDKQQETNWEIDDSPNTYILDNIINAEDNASMDMETFNAIFNNSQSNLKDRQKYSDYNALLEDYRKGNKYKKKRATEVINAIHKAVKDQINQGYEKENEKFQIEYNKKKEEVLPKLKQYFNEIAQNEEIGDDIGDPMSVKYGGSLPKAQNGGDYPTQADIDKFHTLNNENYLDAQRQAVGDNINVLLEHNVDMWRPDVSRYENLNPLKNCWYDNTCVEAVKNGYEWAGYDSGIPDNVYDNETFFKNYKDYGFELIDIKDVSDIKKGDVLQYYTEAAQHDFSENHWTDRRILGIDDDNPVLDFPENQFHMGIYMGDGMYWGDGSKDEPALLSDIYKNEDGTDKNKFRVFRKKKADYISKKQYGGSLPKAQSGLGKLFQTKPRTQKGIITNIADDINLYGYNYAKDAFGNTGSMLSGSVYIPADYSRSIRNFRGLQNTSEYDPSTRFLMNEYTVDSAPFKFSEQDWIDNPSGWYASTLLGADGKPLHISDNSLALALSNKIQGNNVIWKNTTNQEQPINLTRNFNLGQNTLTGIHGDINQLRELYKSGDPYQLGSITSWGIGNTGLRQFGTDRYVIKDFNTDYPALLNEYKGLTDNQAKTWRERELLLDDPTFKVTNIIENAPRLPDWRITTSPETVLKGTHGASDWKIGEDIWKNTGDGNIITHFSPFNKYVLGKKNPYYESLQDISRTDPNFRIKAIPNYGTDIELKIIKKKGGEIMKKSKYQDSPFTKGKITYSDPTKILNDLISKGVFTSEFKMGGEKKLDNGFTIKKQFDNSKNIPYVTYMNEPNIEGRIYYDSDSGEDLNDFNVINVEEDLIKRKIKHNRTKDIILKYESGDELSNAERAHLNSLGLLD